MTTSDMRNSGQEKYVCLYRDEQHEYSSFDGVSCTYSAFKMSVILQNVNSSNADTYECWYKDDKGGEFTKINSTILIVDATDGDSPTGNTNRNKTASTPGSDVARNSTAHQATTNPPTTQHNVDGVWLGVSLCVGLGVLVVVGVGVGVFVWYRRPIVSFLNCCRRPRSDEPVSYKQCSQNQDENDKIQACLPG